MTGASRFLIGLVTCFATHGGIPRRADDVAAARAPACPAHDRPPRTRPDRVLADKAYSSRAIRAHLRTRGIGSVIPELDDQKAHRKRIGSSGD